MLIMRLPSCFIQNHAKACLELPGSRACPISFLAYLARVVKCNPFTMHMLSRERKCWQPGAAHSAGALQPTRAPAGLSCRWWSPW